MDTKQFGEFKTLMQDLVDEVKLAGGDTGGTNRQTAAFQRKDNQQKAPFFCWPHRHLPAMAL